MENDFLLILLFSSLNSEMKQTIPFFLGILKIRASHLELLLYFYTSISIYLLSSILRVSLYIFEIGNGLEWYGLAPSKKLNCKLSACFVS